MIIRRVPGFRPSRSGFHFPNRFHRQPVLVLSVGPLTIPIGNASRGMCGGMVFATRDLFEASASPPPDRLAPERGSQLFTYLVRRLFGSFNLPGGPLRYMLWMALPIRRFPGFPGLAGWTAQEWTRIRAELDAGRLAALGLVRAWSLSPLRLARNHQVLAYGYDLEEATGRLSLWVYDPNHPDQDQIALMLRLGPGGVEGPIDYVPGEHPVRGFFLTHYRPVDPAVAVQP